MCLFLFVIALILFIYLLTQLLLFKFIIRQQKLKGEWSVQLHPSRQLLPTETTSSHLKILNNFLNQITVLIVFIMLNHFHQEVAMFYYTSSIALRTILKI